MQSINTSETRVDGALPSRPDGALDRLSDDARRELLDGLRAKIKRLTASRLALAEAIQPHEAIAKRLEERLPARSRWGWWEAAAGSVRRFRRVSQGGVR
jgi:hypothetical protein